MKKFKNLFVVLILSIVTGVAFTSCSKDDKDEPKQVNLVGKWEHVETYEEDDEIETVKMILTFNSDRTGSIVEEWTSQTKATSHETYRMDFSWTTITDASGNEILKVSYVSGDKDTEIFYGSSDTVLWNRNFVLTGNILNIYDGEGVWVFNRK